MKPSCFLHGLRCRYLDAHVDLGEQQAFYGGKEDAGRLRRPADHPYLGAIPDKGLCEPCVQRVKFTRESLRETNSGIKSAHTVAEWSFASLHSTHTYGAAVATRHPPLTGRPVLQQRDHESVCAICAQEVVYEPTGEVSELKQCSGRFEGAGCPLSYHSVCLQLAGLSALQDGRACFFCSAGAGGDDEHRRRMFVPWESVQKKIRSTGHGMRRAPALLLPPSAHAAPHASAAPHESAAMGASDVSGASTTVVLSAASTATAAASAAASASASASASATASASTSASASASGSAAAERPSAVALGKRKTADPPPLPRGYVLKKDRSMPPPKQPAKPRPPHVPLPAAGPPAPPAPLAQPPAAPLIALPYQTGARVCVAAEDGGWNAGTVKAADMYKCLVTFDNGNEVQVPVDLLEPEDDANDADLQLALELSAADADGSEQVAAQVEDQAGAEAADDTETPRQPDASLPLKQKRHDEEEEEEEDDDDDDDEEGVTSAGKKKFEPRKQWVQCNSCDKWRSLPSGMQPKTSTWFCDYLFASCDVPEDSTRDEYDDDDEEVEVEVEVEDFPPSYADELVKEGKAARSPPVHAQPGAISDLQTNDEVWVHGFHTDNRGIDPLYYRARVVPPAADKCNEQGGLMLVFDDDDQPFPDLAELKEYTWVRIAAAVQCARHVHCVKKGRHPGRCRIRPPNAPAAAPPPPPAAAAVPAIALTAPPAVALPAITSIAPPAVATAPASESHSSGSGRLMSSIGEMGRNAAAILTQHRTAAAAPQAGAGGTSTSNGELVNVLMSNNLLGSGGQSNVFSGKVLDGFLAIGRRVFDQVIKVGMEIAVKVPKYGAPEDTPVRMQWESRIYDRIRMYNLPNLMQQVGFDTDQNRLMLPLMSGGSVEDCLEFNRRKKELFVAKDTDARMRLVVYALEALVTGLAHLHSIDATHRDLKPANLLLRRRPTDVGFGPADIMVGDFGYSMCTPAGVGAQHDLPGTHPYVPPDVLSLRLQRRKLTTGVLKAAAGVDSIREHVESICKDHNRNKDDEWRISDLEAIARLKELPVVREGRVLVEELGTFMMDLDGLSTDWKANDIYTAGICIWKLFHPSGNPFPRLRHGQTNQDRDLHRHLTCKPPNRPQLGGEAAKEAYPDQLWLIITGAGLTPAELARDHDDWLVKSWHSDAAARPSADELRKSVRRVVDTFCEEDEEASRILDRDGQPNVRHRRSDDTPDDAPPTAPRASRPADASSSTTQAAVHTCTICQRIFGNAGSLTRHYNACSRDAARDAAPAPASQPSAIVPQKHEGRIQIDSRVKHQKYGTGTIVANNGSWLTLLVPPGETFNVRKNECQIWPPLADGGSGNNDPLQDDESEDDESEDDDDDDDDDTSLIEVKRRRKRKGIFSRINPPKRSRMGI